MRLLFNDEAMADQAAKIGQAILASFSSHLLEIAEMRAGKRYATYKRIHKFLKKAYPCSTLWRLLSDNAEFVIADPTEIELSRPNSWRP